MKRFAWLVVLLVACAGVSAYTSSSSSYASTFSIHTVTAAANSSNYSSSVTQFLVPAQTNSSSLSQQLGLVRQYSRLLVEPRLSLFSASDIDTDSVTISLQTDRNATCRYAPNHEVYSSMTDFSTTGQQAHSIIVSGLLADTSYTYYARCRDAGIISSLASVSFTTDQEESTSSGGGGGGGGGGGAGYAPAADSDREARLDVSFAAGGSREEFSIAKADLSVEQVSFTLASQTTSGSVAVTRKDDSPVPFSRDVYEVVEFVPGSLQVRDVEIGFRVQKSWIDARGAAADVRLYRLVDGEWVELSTRITETDGLTYRFAASSPGFSFFLIGMRDPLPPPEQSSQSNASANGSQNLTGNASASGEESALNTRPEQESAPASSPWPLLLWVFAAVLVGIVAVFGVRRYRQQPDESDKSSQESSQDGLSARERFEQAVERAMLAVQKDDHATAHDEYLAAHEAYSQASEEPETWLEDAYERLTKVYDGIQRESSEQ